MRKLQFSANCATHTHPDSNACHVTQGYVAELLSKKLSHYGFQTLSQSGDQIAVSVEDQTLPLSVTCQSLSTDGHMVCEITSHPEEEQDWLARITEQSLLNQLAQAVENTLKDNSEFSDFEWKNGES